MTDGLRGNPEQRWFIQSLRAYERENGPMGAAWNISALMDRLNRDYEKRWTGEENRDG